ncbi:MAG: ABC transporter ATP-binding protein [Pseudomonadota bacterium]
MLAFDQLGKSFTVDGDEQQVLTDISAQVNRREFLAIVGASGCGKSTLIRIAAGLEAPSSGQVLLENRPVTGPGPERGMVFQQFSLFPWLTVKHNVMFGLRSRGHSKATSEEIALQWVTLVGLAKHADYLPSQLSGGMQQRVAIARALAPSPKVLLMDEPFAALDPQTRSRMQAYLIDIWRNVDVTIIFVTHDLEEAVLLADRVLVLAPNPGRLEATFSINLPREASGRDRYSPAFVEKLRSLQTLTNESAQDLEPDLDMIRLARVDGRAS